MKTQPTTLALIAATILLSGLFCQTVQSQSVITNGTATLGPTSGGSGNELSVAYTVTDNDGVYTYDYTVNNPSTDTGVVTSFEVGFDTSPLGAVDPTSVGDSGPQISAPGVQSVGVDWYPIIGVGDSETLWFQSDEPPTLGNANANGNNPPGPWASTLPGGQQVPVPYLIPEPATTSLLAMTLLALPLRFRGHKIELNRKRN